AYFLAYDDTEYSLRIKKAGFTHWLVPDSAIDHLRPALSRLRNSAFGPKHYYNIRNRIVVAREYTRLNWISVAVSVLTGFAIWIVGGGLRQSGSFSLLLRSIKDGIKGRLGGI
ncbi:MAG: glycosyltransferase family 2 protein, partial [Gammaproteobacteria bacterium]